MTDSLTSLTLTQARHAIRAGTLSPLELTRAHLDRIEAINPKVIAYLEVVSESALRQARIATETLKTGARMGPLHGIPLALKDLFDVGGMHTTAGSVLWKENLVGRKGALPGDGSAPEAFVVQRLVQAGAILLGKLNLHEWALGVTNVNPHFGACRNPWNLDCMSGGSSGGSAAALASELCLGSLGTDTGGSIRIPASLCGVVGLKPTFGRVSVRGVVPLAWSHDHVGPMARTVRDVAALLNIISRYDIQDPLSVDRPAEDFEGPLDTISPPLRFIVGVLDDELMAGIHPETKEALNQALQLIQELGCEIKEIKLKGHEQVFEASARMVVTEAAAFHRERLQQHPGSFGPDVLARLRAGSMVSGSDYVLAHRLQSEWRRRMMRIFETVDLIVLPATPVPAVPIAASDSLQLAGGGLTRFARLFNIAGIPALVLPCGFTAEGLPIGLQIAGPAWSESHVLQLAYAYESATKWHTRRPLL
jgi:aspartyl-tRNA(Asn)/glutamyl-tRNA(Gln) amidotransferase subunit A